jgi:hypothetical protein
MTMLIAICSLLFLVGAVTGYLLRIKIFLIELAILLVATAPSALYLESSVTYAVVTMMITQLSLQLGYLAGLSLRAFFVSKTKTIADIYFEAAYPKAIACFGGLGAFALLAWHLNDFAGAALIIFLMTAVFTNLSIIKVRIDQGYFGSTADDAVELILFILRSKNKSKLPPGTAVAPSYGSPKSIPEATAAATP